MDLYDFQIAASEKMAARTTAYLENPVAIARGGDVTKVPYVQFLSSITASGKTLILADAVSVVAKQLPAPPVILWLSRATVVVEQSFANLDAGGEYNELLQGSEVRLLSELRAVELQESGAYFLYFATVGTFNRADRDEGLRVFRSSLDDAAEAIWDELKRRPAPGNIRRPLLVVYDEAHNLSDQQTELLLELEPDAFLLATATARLPARFNEEVVERLKNLSGMDDDDIIVDVPPSEVAESGLIKTEVELIGRQAASETVISEMVEALNDTTSEAGAHGLEGAPKAVYVCKTNVVEGSDEPDDPRQPFRQRKAPPILIWRHLTENLGVPPEQVAVYCNLSTHREYPLPDDFVLFSGGDRDYDNFIRGDFRHVIFNKTLQEGWDEPLVYFAYIDKSMGSRVETRQVVGRLLRQPGRRHYPSDPLNRARLHVRVEAPGVFEEVVQDVNEKIRAEGLPVSIARSAPGAAAKKEFHPRGDYFVPRVATPADEAEAPIRAHVAKMNDYREDSGVNVVGTGRRTRVQRIVGGDGDRHYEWEEVGESAKVVARWLFGREVRKVHPLALSMVVTGNDDGTSSKFDARVGLGSNAAEHIADVARKVGRAYVDNVYLKLTRPNPYRVGSMAMPPSEVVEFHNSVHAGYSGLNPALEMPFAEALDRVGRPWARNPSQSGYSIPLVSPGKTRQFFPDFLVWVDDAVFAIDTKGPHLHEDARRKLVNIRPARPGAPKLHIRFVTNGRVEESGPTPDASGFTVWSFAPSGARRFAHLEDMDRAVSACLEPDV